MSKDNLLHQYMSKKRGFSLLTQFVGDPVFVIRVIPERWSTDFHDKNTSKSTSLKICMAIETVLFRLTTGRLDSDAKENASCKFSTKQILI